MFDKDLYFSVLKTEKLGRKFNWFDSISSTNDFLLADKSLRYDIIVADNQLNGRGRSGRSWFTDNNGLAFSIDLPINNISYLMPLNIVAGYSLIDSLQKYAPVKMKWPNDCVIMGEKVCGMLIDTLFNGSNLEKTVLGIGINLKTIDFITDTNIKATFISKWSKLEIKREVILAEIINNLEKYLYLLTNNSIDIVEKWKNYSSNINKEIKVHINNQVKSFIEKGINKDGCLIVENNYGDEEIIFSGEIGYDFSC